MNNMTKQLTAVEWLIEQLTPSIALQQKYIDELKEQALEQEKQQMIDFYTQASMRDNELPYGMQYISKLEDVIQEAEDLYNKTFNKQKI